MLNNYFIVVFHACEYANVLRLWILTLIEILALIIMGLCNYFFHAHSICYIQFVPKS